MRKAMIRTIAVATTTGTAAADSKRGRMLTEARTLRGPSGPSINKSTV